MNVATAIVSGSEVSPDLAAQAVEEAMASAKLTTASSVLLFLSSEFARDPLPALRLASKQAHCMQVMGCSAPGIFTEQDWVLDAPAAAAMVFGHDITLEPPVKGNASQLLLTLAAPNAINTTWMSASGIRFGGVSGDATGQGPFSVWQNSKGAAMGHCEAALQGVRGVVAAAHGLNFLNMPKIVSQVDGHDITRLGETSGLHSLQRASMMEGELPLHLLMAVYADDAQSIMDGDYQIATLVSCNDVQQSVTLAKKVKPGQYLCWAIRETEATLADLQKTALNLSAELGAKPDFGLMFSCLGRGPYFYGGLDHDLLLLKKLFPKMPLIGFYGNGEIAPCNARPEGNAELLQYSAVLGLFSRSHAQMLHK